MVKAASGLSTQDDPVVAAADAARQIDEVLEGVPPELVAIFMSAEHADGADDVLQIVHDRLRPSHVIGSTGEFVVGRGREVENVPAVSMWAVSSPEAVLETFHIHVIRTGDGLVLAGLPDFGHARGAIMLADRFTFPADRFLARISDQWPGVVVSGGMASGGTRPGDARLFADRRVHEEGAVGVIVRGGLRMRTLVSQGCRPVGDVWTITKAEGTVVYELGGKPALQRLQEAVAKADDRERTLIESGLLLGIVVDEVKESFAVGDFLIRSVIGFDPRDGSIVIGDAVEVGRSVQFHVRDAQSATSELESLLKDVGPPPSGALLFTCNGRGTRMFPSPNHDAAAIDRLLGSPPLAGMFCAGEMGAVGQRNFMHGFTASIALFYDD